MANFEVGTEISLVDSSGKWIVRDCQLLHNPKESQPGDLIVAASRAAFIDSLSGDGETVYLGIDTNEGKTGVAITRSELKRIFELAG